MGTRHSSRKPQRNWVDLIVRVVLAMLFAIGAGLDFNAAAVQFRKLDLSTIDPQIFSRGLSVAAIGLYTVTMAVLYVVRLEVKKTAAGTLPSVSAILGACLLSSLLLIKQPDLPSWLQTIACCLIVIGNLLSVYVLFHLGRSFSILPQSRKLVATGPYKIVRHPLYISEAVSAIGILISFLSPLAVLIVMAQLTLQLTRMHFEEKILRETFSEYKNYARKTSRLIPGVY
jgi:protein-S-isoprenylcysteine O-methyltransferase Ste14